MDVKYGYRRAQGFDISGTRFGFFAIMQDEPQGAVDSPRLSNRFGGLALVSAPCPYGRGAFLL